MRHPPRNRSGPRRFDSKFVGGCAVGLAAAFLYQQAALLLLGPSPLPPPEAVPQAPPPAGVLIGLGLGLGLGLGRYQRLCRMLHGLCRTLHAPPPAGGYHSTNGYHSANH